MKTKLLYSAILLFIASAFTACKKDLEAIPTNLLPPEVVYTDKNLITSVLAQFYATVNGYGANNNDWNKFQLDPDDGVNNDGAPSSGNLAWGRDRYRVMDYSLVRRMNQFLEGIRSEASKKAMSAGENANFEGQCLFLRAYHYFYMTRTLGGMSIVGDKVFDYTLGEDLTTVRLKRNTEAECYQYVMDQCDSAAKMLNIPDASNANRGMANRWAAKTLKAKAAITAASIAKYTPLRAPGNVTPGGEVGIPASRANGFYTSALEAAKDVILNSPYTIMKNAANPEMAFYQATTLKTGNTEVIWAYDRKSPAVNTQYTANVMPLSHSDGNTGNKLGATLNLVEAFENRDGSNPQIKVKNGTTPYGMAAGETYVFYDDVELPFKAKDARLWGTVLWPNALYRGTQVPLQAGELTKATPPYTIRTSAPARGVAGPTGPNGPANVSTNNVNKTGFNVRKWLDEKPGAGVLPNFSDVWFPHLRLADDYLIVAEAAFELGDLPTAVQYINVLRDRGRIQPLTQTTINFDKIVNEYRVEFAYEDHRLWDLIRWRLAHTIWNGVVDDPNAQAKSLYAYKVNAPGDPNNGKWVFEKNRAYRRVTTPFTFDVTAYYSTITQSWVSPNNPNWVLNPYQ
jgi:starch-binding outer membrane protein, SusD/RagB family